MKINQKNLRESLNHIVLAELNRKLIAEECKNINSSHNKHPSILIVNDCLVSRFLNETIPIYYVDICVYVLSVINVRLVYYGGNNELEFLAMSAMPEINQFRWRGLHTTDGMP